MKRGSAFTYNVVRPYPFKWFTPVVIVLGLIAIVLVTLLSITTSGYQLTSVSSTNPNATVAERNWLSRYPSYLVADMKAQCESATLPLDSQLYTNNPALQYTLTSVWLAGQDSESTTDLTSFGSLVYHNNPLEDCLLNRIMIQLQSLDCPAGEIGDEGITVFMDAYITCSMNTAQGLVNLDLTASYQLLLEAALDNPIARFPGRNMQTKASLFLGETMLAMYWIQLANVYDVANHNLTNPCFEGKLQLARLSEPPADVADVESLSFFDVSITGMNETNSLPFPDIWEPADRVSKALYYTIMADLGQNTTNIFTNPSLLEYFTAEFTQISFEYNNDSTNPWLQNAQPYIVGLPYEPYTEAQNGSEYRLGFHKSTFLVTYLCQVPQVKPWASLFFSVIVADLVLLQALWKLFTLVISRALTRKYPQMRYCEGCVQNEMIALRKSRRGNATTSMLLDDDQSADHANDHAPLTKTDTAYYRS